METDTHAGKIRALLTAEARRFDDLLEHEIREYFGLRNERPLEHASRYNLRVRPGSTVLFDRQANRPILEVYRGSALTLDIVRYYLDETKPPEITEAARFRYGPKRL